MFDFTPKDVEREVRAVAKEYPTYVYDSGQNGDCFYFHTGIGTNYSCGCIIGHALHRLGVTPEDIPGSNASGVTGLFRKYMPLGNSDDRTLSWLSSVQVLQDKKFPWAEAVKAADEVQ